MQLEQQGVLENSIPSEVYDLPNIKRFLIQHNNVVDFLNKNDQKLSPAVTIQIYARDEYFTKICQVEIDEHKMITLDIHHEALKYSNLSFEVQNKLFQVILRGEGNLQLNTAGTFKSSQEVAILNYGTRGDKTFHVPYEDYYDSANTIKGFTTEEKSRSFNRNEQRLFPTCNLDWLYNAPNIKKMFINHERKFMLTKPTSALSCPEELWVFHGKVDSNFLLQLQMSNMKKLVLGKCGLNVFPQEINQAKQLEVLSLRENDFNDQPIDLALLTEIEALYLSYFKINTCPQGLHKLQKLKDINLSYNNLNICLEIMEVIHNIITFKASSSKITVFPKALGKMKSLQTLDLEGHKFEQYGKANKDETNLDQIGDVTMLTQLDFSYCHLNTIPQKIYQLPNLEELNIQLNQLKELPKPVLDMLKRDTEIWASDNPLERPPQIMCSQYGGLPLDNAKILKYFEDLEKFGETRSNRLRVVVTGNSKAGKTSIINGLLSGLSSLEEEQKHTSGIEIRIFYVSEEELELDILDYLRQESYQPIHNFYLHSGSLFLLVVDIHTYETTDQTYSEHVGSWIANIRAKMLRPVFIVVANKTDTFYAVDTYYEIIPDE